VVSLLLYSAKLPYSVEYKFACGEIQMLSHIVNDCPEIKLSGGLHCVHLANGALVNWLVTCGI